MEEVGKLRGEGRNHLSSVRAVGAHCEDRGGSLARVDDATVRDQPVSPGGVADAGAVYPSVMVMPTTASAATRRWDWDMRLVPFSVVRLLSAGNVGGDRLRAHAAE